MRLKNTLRIKNNWRQSEKLFISAGNNVSNINLCLREGEIMNKREKIINGIVMAVCFCGILLATYLGRKFDV